MAIDLLGLNERLLGKWADRRRQGRAFAQRPVVTRVPGESLREHRDRVLRALEEMAAERLSYLAFPTSAGGSGDHGGNIAAFEETVLGDPSIGIKAGVQWGLFGAAIMHLGTETHHERWLQDVMDFRLPGAFAMTETGHGSDVASIGTTATYDPATEEFVIHTPFRGAWKDYLGNAAEHGEAATVFAQLITNGENHGVHCFFVPIRDHETKAFLPGVGGEDDGVKGGLNGVDNGRLHFDHVRIPRMNLLNRYGDVAPDGTYSSPIASKGRRFFTMLGTLVQGRVSLDSSATNAAQLGLTIAIKYANVRRQFAGGKGLPETVLLDYGRHQRRLLPRLAQVYAMSFAHEELLLEFDEVFSGRNDDDAARQDLETHAAALKPLSTWATLDILQEAREACGGAGYLAENRLAPLRADLDIWVTFEGDNNVLLQLVGKRLLMDYAKAFKASPIGTLLRSRMPRPRGALRSTEFQRALLTDRAGRQVAEVAAALRPAAKRAPADGAAIFNRHQNALIAAARSHGELLQWEAFTRAVDATEDGETKDVLTALRDLFGLTLIEQGAGWLLSRRRLSAARARAVTAIIDGELLPIVREHAVDLVEAFGIPDALIGAPIATGAEAARQQEAQEARELAADR